MNQTPALSGGWSILLHLLLLPPPQRLVASGNFSLECLGISSPRFTELPDPGALGYGCPGL